MLVLIKVIDKMKDELGKVYMTEYTYVYGLAPKVYAFEQVHIDKTLSYKKKDMGTKKMATKKTLTFDHCKKCFFNNETVKCIQYRIKSSPSSVDTLKMTKIALKN